MPFVGFCMAAAFIIQLVILFPLQNHCGKFRYFSLLMLELLPSSGALYYAVQQPPRPYLGWEFGFAVCLWIVGAVFLGYMSAWGIFIIKTKNGR